MRGAKPAVTNRQPHGTSRRQRTQPLRVLYCITDTDVGGAERFLLRLLRHFPKGAVAPEVVSLLPAGRLANQIRSLGVPVTSLNMSRVRSLAALAKLRNLLLHKDWDLVHSILVHGNLAARFARWSLPRTPLISSVRVAERGKSWQRRAEQLTWRMSDAVVAVSEAVATFLRRAGVARHRIHVIPNSVDTTEVRNARAVPRTEIGVANDAPLILFVGRLHRQKGLDLLLHALAVLHHSLPHAVLAVAGDGPERPRLARLAVELGVADHVRWLGWQPNPLGLMKTADVLAAPSRWEGMPNVILEAMAAGTPVVGTAVEGITELLRPGRGVLVPPDDPTGLAEALRHLLGDAHRRSQIAAEAMQYVRSYPPEQEAERYVELYRLIVTASS